MARIRPGRQDPWEEIFDVLDMEESGVFRANKSTRHQESEGFIENHQEHRQEQPRSAKRSEYQRNQF